MNKKLAFIVLGLICFSLYATAKPGDTMYVSVQKAPIKVSASTFGRTVDTAAYGNVVTVLAEQGKWIQVKLNAKPSVSGWIASSSLTTKKIVVKDGGSAVSASADEIALAGKGFNKQVEDSYRSNKTLNYDAVDKLEAFALDMEQTRQFIVSGSLKGAEE